MRLRLTGRLHLRWRSLQTPVTKELHPLKPTTSPTTASITPRVATRLTTTRQLSWINYTSRSTRQPLLHHCLTTHPTLSFSLHLHWKSINYSHNNKQLHFHNWTYTRPIHCIPGDLRMPHYNSTLLSVSLPEAANVHYYHTTSLHTTTGNNTIYVIIQLQIGQQLLLRYLTSGQFPLHQRYISYMMSVQQNYYLPTTQHPQTIYKVDYDMTTFTDSYSLRNRTITCHYFYWNYSTTSTTETNSTTFHKAITTILCKSIQYYGFTLLTMTNLTQHHKALLHRFLTDYDQHMSCPEIDDERLRGAPNYMTTFFTTHYYATLDSRLQTVQAYRAQNWALHA